MGENLFCYFLAENIFSRIWKGKKESRRWVEKETKGVEEEERDRGGEGGGERGAKQLPEGLFNLVKTFPRISFRRGIHSSSSFAFPLFLFNFSFSPFPLFLFFFLNYLWRREKINETLIYIYIWAALQNGPWQPISWNLNFFFPLGFFSFAVCFPYLFFPLFSFTLLLYNEF